MVDFYQARFGGGLNQYHNVAAGNLRVKRIQIRNSMFARLAAER
jgi:hypothetical protein